ncbi:MAG: hypothetical protein FWF87_02095 [Synergistaceae bacterium]|nr:hypothetical protein [Synergistaceae bacterium]
MLSLKEQAIEFIRAIPDNKLVYIMDVFDGIKGLLDDTSDTQKAPLEETLPSAMGIFRKYANPSLVPYEKDAWGNALKDKYVNY